MKVIKRTIYLLYYLKGKDLKQISRFLDYAARETGKKRLVIIVDVIISVIRYNVSIKDYFCFRFFELNSRDRESWAGTGFMYEYQLIMNPKPARDLLEDKTMFLNHFKQYIHRKFMSFEEIKHNIDDLENLLRNPAGRLVLKGSHGQVGAEVEVIHCNDWTTQALLGYMKKKKYDLVEEYVVQHRALMDLSPSGLNTVRIFTQLHEGKVIFLGARLRITVNSPVDNMAAGNLAAPVDIETGIVSGPGVYSDITKEDMAVHPVTGIVIVGFRVPFWDAVINLARNVALLSNGNRSVGWDIAITEEGPELIEGNHNWCKLLWQMPVKRGLKSELEKYLVEHNKK